MARADAEIDQEFGIEPVSANYHRNSKLVQISKLSRKFHMTYGSFVSKYSEEEISELLELQEGGLL